MDNELSIERLQYNVNSAINVCNARLENGVDLAKAFNWLQEEIDQIFEGEDLYETE